MFEFSITGKLLGHGRTGVFQTPHGIIHTPVFMPVGTNASVKSVPTECLFDLGAQMILANNYHLYLRPGSHLIHQLGGIHRFMNWDHPILTDSGGFQVFSLGEPKKLRKLAELTKNTTLRDPNLIETSNEGVRFRSHLDGSSHFFTPEEAIKSQQLIGADIIMALDVCTPDLADRDTSQIALRRTHSWLARCKTQWQKTCKHGPSKINQQALFGIIQGAMYQDLRRESAQFVVDQNLPGIAIGGETIGYNMAGTTQVMDWIRDLLPDNKPRYTMGLGLKPSDLLTAIMAGSDMFDCVAPTRLARNGALYTGQVKVKDNRYYFESEFPQERLNIANSRFKNDPNPIDPRCDCSTCKHYSLAYLNHLFHNKELLYYQLASIHNLRFMIKITQDAINLSPYSPKFAL